MVIDMGRNTQMKEVEILDQDGQGQDHQVGGFGLGGDGNSVDGSSRASRSTLR